MGILQEKTNNPLNIRYNPANKWKGQTGHYKGFCQFKNEAYGFRAGFRLLTNYIRNQCDTIEEIISRWAPPTENDTESYIRFVCAETLIDRDIVLGWVTIHDYWTIIIIMRAMARMECGKWYDEQQINLFINYPDKY